MAETTKHKRARILKSLDIMLSKATMSPALRNAIVEIKEALIEGDFNKAAAISGVKSYISGDINWKPRENAFREDFDGNAKKLGISLYQALDSINFELAMMTRSIPSGMTIFTTEGAYTNKVPSRKSKSKTLARIRVEHDNIVKSSDARRRREERAMKNKQKNIR